jgi:phosphoribosyl 1,2-cyclic phosphodiesterase
LRLRILRSGSSGNAILVDAGDARLLVDAGLPAEVIVRELAALSVLPHDLTAVLLTHEHYDHAKGALTLSRMAGCPVLANEGTITSAGAALEGAHLERFSTGRPFRVGSLTIDAFALSHDAAEPVGFSISQNGSRLVIATDLGASGDEIVERAREVDLLIIESNYDLRLLSVSPYPWFLKNRILSTTGHLSNDAAAQTILGAAAGRLRSAVLVHLSDINNLTPLARDTVHWALEREGITHVAVDAVRPNGASKTYVLQ